MDIGVFVPPFELDRFVEDVRGVADAGFPSVWCPQVMSLDALTAISVAGREVPGVAFGTAVIPTYPRHPTALAAQALTTQAATGNRLSLGIGLSHQVVIEGMLGMSFDKPARHMREYLSILMPLLHERGVAFEGETLTARMQLQAGGDVTAPPVLVAALAPAMLGITGRMADGTVTWMVGRKTLAEHIVPRIGKAAADAGRPAPRIVCALPVVVTDDLGEARERAANAWSLYNGLPSYRAMLDREGAEGPVDVVIMGDEVSVKSQIESVYEAGATEFVAVPFMARERTMAALASYL